MSQSISLRLCLVVFLCLSGCNALSGGDTAETPMVTPADVPTDETMPSYGFAPGLTKQGVIDPIALGRAHEAVLNNTSYTVRTKITMRYTNGTLRNRVVITTHVEAPVEQYYTTASRYAPNVGGMNYTTKNRATWSNGERTLIAHFASQTNTTTYDKSSTNFGERYPRGEQFYGLFQIIDTRIVNHTTRNGTTLYRITATGISDPARLSDRGIAEMKNIRNISFYAVIDSRGLVHEYRFAYTATLTETNRPTSIRITRTVRYTKIGSTTVERPSWYSAANQTTSTPSGRTLSITRPNNRLTWVNHPGTTHRRDKQV